MDIDIDINAKLPIIRSDSVEYTLLNGINGCNHPKPSFRLADNFAYRKKKYTASSRKSKRDSDSYYRYEEPTPEALLERVEYDMDCQDTEWLKSFNEKHASKFNYTVNENEFERIMDRLEKESYFESKRTGKEIAPAIDEDAVCTICNDGDVVNSNAIIFCDMCDLAVHQECYGIPYIPEGQWLCRRCLQSPSRNVECVLCPNKGGAFKQTDDNRWAHVICALWIPEVCFANTVFLEPIDSLNQIPPARWKLTCYICKQKKAGACIQCNKPNCYVPFHVTCAQQANLYMKIRTHRYPTESGYVFDVKKEAFCDLHAPKSKKNGGAMYSENESDESDRDSYASKKRKQAKRDKMKKTRMILAEKRTKAPNPVAEPKVEEQKLVEISRLLTIRGKRKVPQQFEGLRKELIKSIYNYWILKRAQRNGVPLLRRLQVTYQKNEAAPTAASVESIDKEKYTRLRYDLEKARLLVGEVKRRELLKKRLFRLSKDVVEMKYQVIDKEDPPDED